MKNIMKKWYNHTFEDWGAVTSPEFKDFVKDYKKYLSEIAKEIGAKLVSFSPNHYEFSAFLKRDANYVYFSISDVRYFEDEWRKNILIRRANDDRDYKGETNCKSDLEHLKDNLDSLFVSTAEYHYQKYHDPIYRGLKRRDFINKYGFYDEESEKWAIKSYEIEWGKEDIINASREGESFGTIIYDDALDIYGDKNEELSKNNYSYDGKSYDRVTVYERITLYPSKQEMEKDLSRLFKEYSNFYEKSKDILYSEDYCKFIPKYNDYESKGEYTWDSREDLEEQLSIEDSDLNDVYEFYQSENPFDYVCEKLFKFDTTEEKRKYLSSLTQDQIKELRDNGFGIGTEFGYALFLENEENYQISKIDEMDVYQGDDEAAEYAIKDCMVNILIDEELKNLADSDIKERYELETLRYNLLEKHVNTSNRLSDREYEKIEVKSAILDTLLETDGLENYNDEYVQLLRDNGFEDEDIKEAGFEIDNENIQENE